MKIFSLTSIFTIMVMAVSFAQEPSLGCGTAPVYGDLDPASVPWYGNNSILYDYLDQHAEYLMDRTPPTEKSAGECPEIEAALAIPIKFWIWESTANEDPISNDDLQTLIDAANEVFQANGLNFRFYTYCAEEFVNANYVNVNNGGELDDLNNNGRQDPFAINVHIVVSGQGSSGAWAGVYNSSDDFVAVTRNTAYNLDEAKRVFPHELGHYFGLDHTHIHTEKLLHEGVACCKSEPVTRGKKWHEPCIGCVWVGIPWYSKRCDKTGDYLCDTEADPRPIFPLVTYDNVDCEYTGTATDGYGATYHPDISNVMSYYGNCTHKFSNQQKGIILNQIFTYPSRLFIYASEVNIIDPDKYEPDNSAEVGIPRLISVGETQCHSMSTIYQNDECDDKEDWLRIDNKNGLIGSYKIIVKDVDGTVNPIEDVHIFNSNNGEKAAELSVAFTDNGSERIWEIACSSLTLNTSTSAVDYNDFLVQLIRGEEGGLYKVSLESTIALPTISGSNFACIGETYTVNGLPTGATVSWTGENLGINNASGPSTSIVNVFTGNEHYLRARVEFGGCRYYVYKYLTIGAGTLPSIGEMTVDIFNEGHCTPEFTFSIPPVPGAVSYEWTCSAVANLFCDPSNGTSATALALLNPGQGISFAVTVTAKNGCGGSVSKTRNVYFTCPKDLDGGGDGKRIVISPNPVNTSELTLEIIDPSTVATTYDVQILDQFGNLEYIFESSDKTHYINAEYFLDGLHYARVISETGVVSQGFIVQK